MPAILKFLALLCFLVVTVSAASDSLNWNEMAWLGGGLALYVASELVPALVAIRRD